jgi:hypothetical protein
MILIAVVEKDLGLLLARELQRAVGLRCPLERRNDKWFSFQEAEANGNRRQ